MLIYQLASAYIDKCVSRIIDVDGSWFMNQWCVDCRRESSLFPGICKLDECYLFSCTNSGALYIKLINAITWRFIFEGLFQKQTFNSVVFYQCVVEYIWQPIIVLVEKWFFFKNLFL